MRLLSHPALISLTLLSAVSCHGVGFHVAMCKGGANACGASRWDKPRDAHACHAHCACPESVVAVQGSPLAAAPQVLESTTSSTSRGLTPARGAAPCCTRTSTSSPAAAAGGTPYRPARPARPASRPGYAPPMPRPAAVRTALAAAPQPFCDIAARHMRCSPCRLYVLLSPQAGVL